MPKLSEDPKLYRDKRCVGVYAKFRRDIAKVGVPTNWIITESANLWGLYIKRKMDVKRTTLIRKSFF